MYKDILSYELAEGIKEEQLLKVAKQILDSWMSNQDGFIRWEIHKDAEGEGYTDIVYWQDYESAKNAQKQMCNIPNANEWYGCYKEGSILTKHLNKIF